MKLLCDEGNEAHENSSLHDHLLSTSITKRVILTTISYFCTPLLTMCQGLRKCQTIGVPCYKQLDC